MCTRCHTRSHNDTPGRAAAGTYCGRASDGRGRDSPWSATTAVKAAQCRSPRCGLRVACLAAAVRGSRLGDGPGAVLPALAVGSQPRAPLGTARALPPQLVQLSCQPLFRVLFASSRARPWLQPRAPQPSKASYPYRGEYIQSPAERALLDGSYECILCACCSTACPEWWWQGDAGFMGPAALLHSYRWLADTRDGASRERLQRLTGDSRTLLSCKSIFNCADVCPKHLNVTTAANLTLPTMRQYATMHRHGPLAAHYFSLH